MARELASVEFVANPFQRALDKARSIGPRWVLNLVLYAVLIDMGFVYFLPLAFMVLTSFKSPLDLENPTVVWLPTQLFVQNYTFSWEQLSYIPAVERTLIWVAVATLGQIFSTALVGYGFARYSRRFKIADVLFLLAVFTFLVPPQTIVVSLFLNFKLLGWLNTYYPLTVPEWFAQGLRGAFFIFIFRQAFKALPYELEEAARVDGAGPLSIFFRVMLPLVKPSLSVALVFSVVWHWNTTFGPSNFLQENYKAWPLSMELQEFQNAVLTQNNQMAQASQMMTQSGATSSPNTVTSADQGAIMAAVVLVILPPVLFYLLIQRTFVQGIERTGLIE